VLLRERSGFVDDVRHVDERDERQPWVAVNDREDIVGVIVRHLVSAIIATILS